MNPYSLRDIDDRQLQLWCVSISIPGIRDVDNIVDLGDCGRVNILLEPNGKVAGVFGTSSPKRTIHVGIFLVGFFVNYIPP